MAFLVQAYHTSASPKVCVACHSMADVGSTWQRSNHKQFACVECHMPESNLVSKLLYKTQAGLHDLWHETLRDYPASLSLSAKARTVVNGNCLRCHQSTVERVTMLGGGPISCTKCHRHTMHHKSKT
jgi:cytochrome c nitrite reductase small subunit